MKTLFTILSIAVVAILLAFSEPFKNSSGAQPGHTGSPGDGRNCTFCHGGTALPIEGVFSSDIPAAGYHPGETYTITVTTSGAGRKGFQVSPQNVAGDLLGTLTAGAGNKLVGNDKYVTHSAGVLTPTAEWSFSWTAPEVGTGNVVFYGAFVISQPNVRLSTMEVTEDETIGIGTVARTSLNVYPLPSSNQIRFDYYLAEPSGVAFSVYDLAGRLVHHAEGGYHATGDYTHNLLLGTGVRNNIYFAVMTTGSDKFVKKIVL